MTMVGQAQASPRHLGAVWEQALGIGYNLPGALGGWGLDLCWQGDCSAVITSLLHIILETCASSM